MKKFVASVLNATVWIWCVICFILLLGVVVVMTVFKLPKFIWLAFEEAFNDFNNAYDNLAEEMKKA